MEKKKILILDDSDDFAQGIYEGLKSVKGMQSTFQIDRLIDFGDELQILETRRKAARKTPNQGELNPESRFDDVDILIIDYDLLAIDSSITGETISYLCRCYSSCGLIVGLNQFHKVTPTFDLALNYHLESYADLNLPSQSVINPGLWREPWTGFRPWEWPLLPFALSKFEKQLDGLRGNLDTKIFDFLGLKDLLSTSLSRNALEFISKTEKVEDTTFNGFIDPKGSGNGFLGKDQAFSESVSTRLAAARISKWMEAVLLQGQDIFVDAPHLVSRFPSLLKKDANKIKRWNSVASFMPANKLGLHQGIEESRFKKEEWFSRPVWFWPQITTNDKIKEVLDPWNAKRSEWVFCEDVSKFYPAKEAQSFVADLESPFVKRYARITRDVNYTPQVRFSL